MASRLGRPLALALCVTSLLLAAPATAAPKGELARLLVDPVGRPPATSMVLFGATGDLAKRKILPSLLELDRAGQLPENFTLVAITRTPASEADVLADIEQGVTNLGKVDTSSAAWQSLRAKIRVEQVDTTDKASVARLKGTLDGIDRADGSPRERLYYLSVPASGFEPAVEALAAAHLIGKTGEGARARIVVEKPFGRDEKTSKALNRLLTRVVDESQIHRMDHYLGKKGVLDLLALRFADGTFEGMWDRDHIAKVSITASESIGIGNRGGFYEETGALRDFVQGHLMQVLSLVAMEPPGDGGVREGKVAVLHALRPFTAKSIAIDAVRGQYQGYRDEPGVAKDSRTETYVALRSFVDNPRWRDVPFVLESGKALAEKSSRVEIEFKALSPEVARKFGVAADQPATLVVTIDPEPKIALRVGHDEIAIPSPTVDGQAVSNREPYARLIDGALRGEREISVRGDEALAAWHYLAPVQRAWAHGDEAIGAYERGARRPDAAERLHEMATRVERGARELGRRSETTRVRRFEQRDLMGEGARAVLREGRMRREIERQERGETRTGRGGDRGFEPVVRGHAGMIGAEAHAPM